MTESSINHNSFFECLESLNTDPDLRQSELERSFTNFEEFEENGLVNKENSINTDTQLLKMVISKLSAMQDQLIRLEVKMDNVRGNGPKTAHGRVDMAKLSKLKLPVNSASGLNSLEKDLEEDVKRNEIVRFLLSILNYFYLSVFLFNTKYFIL